MCGAMESVCGVMECVCCVCCVMEGVRVLCDGKCGVWRVCVGSVMESVWCDGGCACVV